MFILRMGPNINNSPVGQVS